MPVSPLHFLQSASAHRAGLPDIADGRTTAYRLLDGMGDGMPGVEIDRYGEHLVVQTREVPFSERNLLMVLRNSFTML